MTCGKCMSMSNLIRIIFTQQKKLSRSCWGVGGGLICTEELEPPISDFREGK
jgi:hypothetical protein